jgi:hypothetical protein
MTEYTPPGDAEAAAVATEWGSLTDLARKLYHLLAPTSTQYKRPIEELVALQKRLEDAWELAGNLYDRLNPVPDTAIDQAYVSNTKTLRLLPRQIN